jgi:hypothetical protein
MARLYSSGFETQQQSTTANYHGETAFDGANNTVVTQVGTPSFDTTNQRSGAACLLCDASGDYVRIATGVYGTLGRTYYTRAALRFSDATPSAATQVIRLEINTVYTASVRLKTDGTLAIFDANSAQVGSASSALSDNTWYVVEMESMIPAAGNGTLGLRVGGTEVARSTDVDVNNSVTSPRMHIGNAAGGVTFNVWVDDVAINDDQGAAQNSHCGLGKVILLKPTGDSALGTGWEAPQTTGSDTTNIYTAVANTPPVGVAHSDVDANNQAYVFNAANVGSDSNYDVNCQTYTAGGIDADDTVLVTQALVRATTASTTGTNNFGIQSVSNPADAGATTGLNLETGAAGGTDPTGWKSYRTPVQYAPSVTKGTSPVVRAIRTQTGITRAHQVDLMGLLVEYLAVTVQEHSGAAALAGTGALTSAAVRSIPAAASASGVGTLESAATRTVLASAALSGTGTVTAAATHADAYALAVLADSPTAYWRLDEPSGTNADDVVGSNDGTYQNTPTLGATGALLRSTNTAASFASGQSEYVSTPLATFGTGQDSPVIELWLKTTTTAAKTLFGVIANGPVVGLNRQADGTTNVGKTRFALTDGGSTYAMHINAPSIYDGAWHHLALWYVGAPFSAIIVYLDGVVQGNLNTSGSGVMDGSYGNWSGGLDIGGLNWVGIGHLDQADVSIDEFAVYSVGLSLARILAHLEAAGYPRASAALSGTGALSGAAIRTRPAASTLAGTGALTAAGVRTRFAAATLAGTGDLTGDATVIPGTVEHFAAAALSGTGTIAAAAVRQRLGASALSGTGTLTPAAAHTALAASALAGTSTLSAAAIRTRPAAAQLAGAGTFTAAAIRATPASAALSGTGDLDATAAHAALTAAALAGAGTLAATATRTRFGAGALSGTGALTATATQTFFASATLSGAGTLTAAATRIRLAAATLAGTGTLTATGEVTTGPVDHAGAAALSGTGALSGAVTRTSFGASALAGAATLSASAIRARFAASTLGGTGALEAAAVRARLAQTLLLGQGTLVCAAARTAVAQSALSGSGSLSGAAVQAVSAAAVLPGLGTLVVYMPAFDTYPDLGGVVEEVLTGGAVVESLRGGEPISGLTGGEVVEPLRGGAVLASIRSGAPYAGLKGGELPLARGGVVDQTLTGGVVAEGLKGGEILDVRSGEVDQQLTGGDPDDNLTGGEPSEPDRDGTYDLVLTGGEIY